MLLPRWAGARGEVVRTGWGHIWRGLSCCGRSCIDLHFCQWLPLGRSGEWALEPGVQAALPRSLTVEGNRDGGHGWRPRKS